jgi:DNA-binding HxlR family transcriptional regulator
LVRFLAVRARAKRRSGCPVSISLELLGDRWSLLIVRDLMVRGFHRFNDFLGSGEGIATNILADRLHRLEAAGIISSQAGRHDARTIHYRLTEKGIDLAPVLLELLIWGARHQKTGLPCAAIELMASRRREVLTEVRRRWRNNDPTQLLPDFTGNGLNAPPPAMRPAPAARAIRSVR